jgi:hypothetical protein
MPRLLPLLILLSLLPALQARAQSSPDQTLLKDGTAVKLKTVQAVSSADVCAGDLIPLQAVEDVRVNNEIVIGQGSPALARVAAVQRKRRMGRGAQLQIELNSVSLINGQQAPLRSINQVQGAGEKGKITAAMIGFSMLPLGGAAAPFFLLVHGKSAVIPEGAEVTAFINGNINVPVDLRSAANAGPQPALTTASSPASNRVTLDIVTKPPGAGVAIDGTAIGNSPACAHVTPGQHTLELTGLGYKPKQLAIKADKGPKQIRAALQKAK